MKLFKATLLVCSLILLANLSFAQSSIIADALICEDVIEREPVNARDTFLVGAKAYCWMKLNNANVGSVVTVKWFVEDKEVHTYDLTVKYPNMRTYAFKTVRQAGKWRAEIRDVSGEVLKKFDFTVLGE